MRRDNTFSEYNFDVMLKFKKDLGHFIQPERSLGFNERRTNNTYFSNATNGGLLVPGVYSLQNTASPLPFPPGG